MGPKTPRRMPSGADPRRNPIAIEQYRATGRRKTAVARVTLKPGTGKRTINDRNFGEYFRNAIREMIVEQPLIVTGVDKQFDVSVSADGGGINGQAGAVRLGIARALLIYKPDLRPMLREHGLLTRDARAVERKKYGKAGARRSFQYSKR